MIIGVDSFIAKFVIEEDLIYTENNKFANDFGDLNLSNFKPLPKTPSISKVFREIGLADELDSRVKNTYKYKKLYSRRTSKFIEGNNFSTIIPLNATATLKTGQI